MNRKKQKYYIWFLIQKNNVYVIDKIVKINPNQSLFKNFPLDINNPSLQEGFKNIYLFDKEGQLGIIKGSLKLDKKKPINEQLKVYGIQLPEFSKEFIDLILLKSSIKQMFTSLKESIKKFDWYNIFFLGFGIAIGYIISIFIA